MDTPTTEMELYDIYSTWHIPFWQTTIFYIIVGVVCFLVLLTIFVWLAIRYRERFIHKKQPWERAIEQLKDIQKIKGVDQFNGRLCYFAMTAILKRYFHEIRGLETLGKTDSEFIQYLKTTHAVSDQIIKNLDEIYNGCVLIRFANQEVVKTHLDKDLLLGINIVKETIPQEKP